MENKYFYSPSTGGFYLENVHDFIPEDAVQIDVDTYSSLLSGQEKGLVITADKNGKPQLSSPPALSKDEELSLAESRKASLMAEATVAINPLQDAVDLGEATSKEEALLKSWKQYRVTLNRMDLSSAPDIKWPERPQ
ncbi:tail fiber assembly protein [Pantoea sp. 9140]|uniref:tail fiber assembly protein n=1 Tax=Pantoea sp. 9140 TaxID=1500896 RepID=UPI0005355DDD|nr:tail fiber assembly protein [Pantoea sp. 9140]